MSDEFYIGWEDRAPAGLRRWVRRVVLDLGALVVLVVGLVAFQQRTLEEGIFEFGVAREFSGVIYETPVPMLRVIGDSGGVTNHLLVGFGKFGLPEFARGHDGQKVTFKGSLICKGARTMIEMNDASSFAVLGKPSATEARGPVESLGAMELTGELVDTKCYFGVMRPATGKVHRACAIRCLSGGVPPGLLVRDAAGNGVVVMLAGPDGNKLDYDVQWAARTVRVRGNLELRDGIPLLNADNLTLVD